MTDHFKNYFELGALQYPEQSLWKAEMLRHYATNPPKEKTNDNDEATDGGYRLPPEEEHGLKPEAGDNADSGGDRLSDGGEDE